MGDYWSTVEPFWDAINIYDGPEAFRQSIDAVPRAASLLFAAHFCRSEICNGGFHQFFWNSTGILAPEAIEGFREIGQTKVADLVQSAVNLFDGPYPRERTLRQDQLAKIAKSVLDPLNDTFYSLIESEAGGFENASDRYAENTKR